MNDRIKVRIKEITTAEIDAVVNNICSSVGDLAEYFGVSYLTASRIPLQFDFCFLPKSQITKQNILRSYELGMSLDELARKTGLSNSTTKVYASQLTLKLAKSHSPSLTFSEIQEKLPKLEQREREMFELVQKGLTLEEIAKPFDMTRERARQIINEKRWYDVWEDNKKRNLSKRAIKRQNPQHAKILSLLNSRIKQELEREEDWARRQALQYRINCKRTNHPENISLEDLTNLFHVYQESRPISFQNLARKSNNISSNQICRIFKKVGLKSHFWNLEYHKRLSNEDKETIVRAMELLSSKEDISYFTGITPQSIRYIFHRLERDVIYAGRKSKLTYRIASQIYEAQDLGFSNQETAELLDKPKEIVEKAIAEKDKISARIMEALNVLYPSIKITPPYLPKYDFMARK